MLLKIIAFNPIRSSLCHLVISANKKIHKTKKNPTHFRRDWEILIKGFFCESLLMDMFLRVSEGGWNQWNKCLQRIKFCKSCPFLRPAFLADLVSWIGACLYFSGFMSLLTQNQSHKELKNFTFHISSHLLTTVIELPFWVFLYVLPD